MKKVVLINQSSGYLMVDIVNAFEKQYDEVVFMFGSIEVLDINLNEKVRLSKLISYQRNSKISRAFTWIWATTQILFRLLFVYRKHEIVYVTNPPMSYLVSLFINRPFSIIVFDIYPDVLRNIGIKETNILYKLWANWNRKLFSRSKRVFTLSEGMKRCLTNYVSEDKIKVIPNWSHSNLFFPVPKTENLFIKEQKLRDKFIVLYSGNIGYTHNVEVIIEAANRLSKDEDIEFLIIGEGGTKQKLQKMATEYGLNNCSFLTWQSKEVLPFSLAAADLAVITLNDETALSSVPSKTYHLLAVGAPLLCIAPKESELNNLVLKHQNGICFEKDQLSDIVNYIRKLKGTLSQRQILSDNSRKASGYYTEQNALKYIEE
jgi:glycosyltransferase involved in cell wall biosynthesis